MTGPHEGPAFGNNPPVYPMCVGQRMLACSYPALLVSHISTQRHDAVSGMDRPDCVKEFRPEPTIPISTVVTARCREDRGFSGRGRKVSSGPLLAHHFGSNRTVPQTKRFDLSDRLERLGAVSTEVRTDTRTEWRPDVSVRRSLVATARCRKRRVSSGARCANHEYGCNGTVALSQRVVREKDRRRGSGSPERLLRTSSLSQLVGRRGSLLRAKRLVEVFAQNLLHSAVSQSVRSVWHVSVRNSYVRTFGQSFLRTSVSKSFGRMGWPPRAKSFFKGLAQNLLRRSVSQSVRS